MEAATGVFACGCGARDLRYIPCKRADRRRGRFATIVDRLRAKVEPLITGSSSGTASHPDRKNGTRTMWPW
jgi:hypothetical protein